MKTIKYISWCLILIGISLTIAGPVWSKIQSKKMYSMQNILQEISDNPDMISAQTPAHKEYAKNMARQMSKYGNAVQYAMRLVYFGVLTSLIGFAGVCFSLSSAIKKRGFPTPASSRTLKS